MPCLTGMNFILSGERAGPFRVDQQIDNQKTRFYLIDEQADFT